MKSTSSSTYKKMRALREAQKLGCSGAHQNSDGQWMPCSSHQKLTEVAPVIASQNRDVISQNRSRRSLKGSNKIKKQWENLGQRGVLNIGNLSSGGLVSGSRTGNFGGDVGGVSAKALPNIFGPRDQDADVFTDIESARQRARQLGCIGVSRRISKTGATVWMPCTNMSDYASRAGTTSLGRRHQKQRLERVINEAIEKRLRKEKKKNKKSLDEDVVFKALGGSIGGNLKRPATFDPNAWDGDSDGRIQDNTPFERPSVPGVNAPPLDGMRSRGKPRLDIDAAQQRSIEGGDTAFRELPLSRKSKKLAKKYLKSFETNFEPIDEKYLFMSDEEIIDLVRANIPSNKEELKEIIARSPFTKNKSRTAWSRIMQAVPDFEATEKMRDALLADIRNSPGTLEMIRRYGVPPIVATENVPSLTWYGNITESWGQSGGGWSHMGFIAMNPTWAEGSMGYKIDDAIRHELAHSWEAMAAVQNDKAREHYALQFAEMYESLLQIAKNKDVVKQELSYHDASWGDDEEHESAARISEYATVARIEWLAESIAALTSSDPAKRAKVDSTAKENIAESFGINRWEVEQIFTPISNSGGFRSQISALPTKRDSDSPTLSNFIKNRYKEDDKLFNESLKWTEQNPQYLSDMSPSIQLASNPETHNKYRRSVVEGFRSYNSGGSIGSGGREMGRKIIDRVDPDEANQDEPTLYFVGGTTGSGKSTMVQRGLMGDVPNQSSAAHIDPDEIKTGLVGWDNGRGASAVHQASRVATDKIMEDAAARRMHMVVQGTGKRREHLINMRRKGYKTSGHFVWIPDDLADQRVARRKERGGANIPTHFGSLIAGELRSGPSSVSRQITDGLYDEFFLYDNSGDVPKLAAQRLSDGSFEIFDDKVFNAFFSPTGAKFVRDYWKSSSKPQQVGSSSPGFKSRSIDRDSLNNNWSYPPGELHHEVVKNRHYNDNEGMIDLVAANVRIRTEDSPIRQATYNQLNGDLIITYANGETFTYERVPWQAIGVLPNTPGFSNSRAKPFDEDFVSSLENYVSRPGGRHFYDPRYQSDISQPSDLSRYLLGNDDRRVMAGGKNALSRWGGGEKTQIPIDASQHTEKDFVPTKITYDDIKQELIVTYKKEGTFTYPNVAQERIRSLEEANVNSQRVLSLVRRSKDSPIVGGDHAPRNTLSRGLQNERARFGLRSRNDVGQSVVMDETLGGFVFRGFGPRTPLTSRDIEQRNLRLAEMMNAMIDPRTDFRNRRAEYINLSRARADGVDFSSSSFFGANMSNMSANGATFGAGQPKQTDLRYAILSAGQFAGSRFDGANMSGVYAASTNFRNAKLRNVDFSNAVLWDADLRGADLRGSNITLDQVMNSKFDERTRFPDGITPPIPSQSIVRSPQPIKHKIPMSVIAGDDADLVRPFLREGKLIISSPIEPSSLELRRRNLDNSSISNVSLNNSLFDGSSMHGSTLDNVELSGSSLFGTNLSKTNLTSVKFDGANLVNSNFRGSTIGRNVSFKKASLVDADFRGAKFLGKVDLRGADLTGAILHGVDLRNAIVDNYTKISGAIGLDKNKAPKALSKNIGPRSVARMTTPEIVNTPSSSLLSAANDALLRIGKMNNANRPDANIDPLIADIQAIYNHFNDIPGINDDLSYINSQLDSQLSNLSKQLDELGKFKFSDNSEMDISRFVKNNDKGGFLLAIKATGKATPASAPMAQWDEIESKLLTQQTINDHKDSISDVSKIVKNKLNGVVAIEAMLSDYGVMNNINDLPDFSIAEPIRRNKPTPTVAMGEIGRNEMMIYNSNNRPTISKIPKSQKVERAINRVNGLASRSAPKSSQGRASRAQEIYQSVSDAIISSLENADGGKWERPWNLGMTIPRNALTQKQYNGFNVVLFALVQQARGYDYPIWATYKQWESLGAQVQRGEKGLTGIKWTARQRDVELPDGTRDSDSYMFPSAFTVFNIAQVSGASPDDFLPPRLSPDERIPAMEEIFGQILPEIRTNNSGSAHYSPSDDYISMPPFESFKDVNAYYATLAHELVHWTGHKDRTDRPNMNKFGTPEYAFEELVAELGSAYLMSLLGMEATPQEQHSQYIRSWIKILKDDPTAIQRAATQAQKAVDYLIEQSPRLKELSTPSIDIEQGMEEVEA